MQLIQKTAVRGWSTMGSVRRPNAIATRCPLCSERVTFSFGDYFEDSKRLANSSTAQCPNCNKPVHIWAIRSELAPKSEVGNPVAIFMYPVSENELPGVNVSGLPAPLERSLNSTLDAFRSKNFTLTAVGSRRTLEGIFKYLVPEAKRNASLARLIELAKEEVDLSAPLTGLSHAIRDGGNLGAHFDSEREPDEQVARQMVLLLNYLISYLYVLPAEIKKLEQGLERSSPTNSDD